MKKRNRTYEETEKFLEEQNYHGNAQDCSPRNPKGAGSPPKSQTKGYYNKASYEKHREKRLAYLRKWRRANKDKVAATRAKYYYKNKEVAIASAVLRNKKHREKTQSSLHHINLRKIRRRGETIVARVKSGVEKHGVCTRDFVGCSLEEYRHYLKGKWEKGMSWENYGEWVIDHILPLSAFDLTDPLQLSAACYYKNTQPLWASENKKKGRVHDPKAVEAYILEYQNLE